MRAKEEWRERWSKIEGEVEGGCRESWEVEGDRGRVGGGCGLNRLVLL